MKKKSSILEETIIKKYDFWNFTRSFQFNEVLGDRWYLLSHDKKTLIYVETFHGFLINVYTRKKKSDPFEYIIRYDNNVNKYNAEFHTFGWLENEINNSSYEYGYNLKYDILLNIVENIVEDFSFIEYTDKMRDESGYLSKKELSNKNIKSLKIYDFDMKRILDKDKFPIKNKGLHIFSEACTYNVRDYYDREYIQITYNDEYLLKVLFNSVEKRWSVHGEEYNKVIKDLEPYLEKVLKVQTIGNDVKTINDIIKKFDTKKEYSFERIMDKINCDSENVLEPQKAIKLMLSGDTLYKDNNEVKWYEKSSVFIVDDKKSNTQEALSSFDNLRLNVI